MFRQIDVQLFYLVNKKCMSPFLDLLMPWITDLGGGQLLVICAIILLIMQKREYRVLGLIILAGLTLSYYSVSLLKDLVARPRPFMILPDVHLLVKDKTFSFPSNHAATAFMAAVAFTGIFKNRIFFFTLATLVAVSRIYLGVHYPFDVFVGALIGMAIGYGLLYVARDSSLIARNRN